MVQPKPTQQVGEPTWEIAELFPLQLFALQEDWPEEDYLQLDTNRLVELSDGHLEFLPMPTQWHQLIALYQYRKLQSFAEENRLGLTLAAPFKVRLWKGKMREPDVILMLAKNRDRRNNQCWDRADLVMEVVSEDDPKPDLVIKRKEYARAGIAEYWIIEPEQATIRVMVLSGKDGGLGYQEAGCFQPGQIAGSKLLPGFEIDVRDALREDSQY